MKNKCNLIVTILFLFIYNIQNAQFIEKDSLKYLEFKGKIINSENKDPLIFANINLLNSNISTISNSSGEFNKCI